MKRPNPPHLSRDVDRHGNVRWYVRMPGRPKVRIREEYDTPAFWSAYRDAMAGKVTVKPKDGAGRRKAALPGSFRSLVERYYGSAEFKGLEATTRRVRRAILDRFCESVTSAGRVYAELPFRAMQPRNVRAIRDRLAETPAAANATVKALRQVFTFAVENDLADANPAKEVPYLPPVRPGGIPAWTEEDVAKFETAHPVGSMARLALVLFTEFGQRISDVHRLGPPMVDGDTITFTQFKNRKRKPVTLTLPLSDAVAHALEVTPHGAETFLVNDYGRPFASTKAFGNKFHDWCDEAGLVDRSADGLRKYFSAKLADHGASDREIMSFTGHRTSKEVDRYTRSANQKRLAVTARRKLGTNEFVPPKSAAEAGGAKRGSMSLRENTPRGKVVPGDGVEPPTRGFSIRCSTN